MVAVAIRVRLYCYSREMILVLVTIPKMNSLVKFEKSLAIYLMLIGGWSDLTLTKVTGFRLSRVHFNYFEHLAI